MRHLLYSMPDGSVQVAKPALHDTLVVDYARDTAGNVLVVDGEILTVRRPITESEMEAAAEACIPKGATNPRWVEFEELPTDRYARDAWVDKGGKVDHDWPKAQEIHRQNLRYVRQRVFPEVDVAFTKALEVLIDKLPLPDEDKAPIRAIIAQKNALRDVTDDPRITEAKTLDDLKAVLPEIVTKQFPQALKVLQHLDAKK